MIDYLLKPIAALLNRGLLESATAEALAHELEGRSLALTVDGTPFDLRIQVTGGRLAVTPRGGAAADATISGGALSLARLLGEDPQAPIRKGAVRIAGDAELAERFRELLLYARPDLEEELSRFVGDPIANQMGNLARGFANWSQQARESFARSLSEYLQQEAGVLPTADEVRDFSRQVDELVNDVARAEARLQRLKSAGG